MKCRECEPIPGLPPFNDVAAMSLAQACVRRLVQVEGGHCQNWRMLRRWCNEGCRIVGNRPRYRFPAIIGTRGWKTCPAWCEAWNAFRSTLIAEEARRFARCP